MQLFSTDMTNEAWLTAITIAFALGWLLRGKGRKSGSDGQRSTFDPLQKQHPSYCPTCGNSLSPSDEYGDECGRCGARFTVRFLR